MSIEQGINHNDKNPNAFIDNTAVYDSLNHQGFAVIQPSSYEHGDRITEDVLEETIKAEMELLSAGTSRGSFHNDEVNLYEWRRNTVSSGGTFKEVGDGTAPVVLVVKGGMGRLSILNGEKTYEGGYQEGTVLIFSSKKHPMVRFDQDEGNNLAVDACAPHNNESDLHFIGAKGRREVREEENRRSEYAQRKYDLMRQLLRLAGMAKIYR